LDEPIDSKPTVEGAGVDLRRAFGFAIRSVFDPFFLNDFRNEMVHCIAIEVRL